MSTDKKGQIDTAQEMPVVEEQFASPDVELTPLPDFEEVPKLPAKPTPPAKKTFTRADVRRTVDVSVHFPRLLEDYEPFEFTFRLALSRDAEERRQEYLTLAPAEATARESNQALDEVCDLLASLPRGFGDLQSLGTTPGYAFRFYVETTTDPDMRAMLDMIVRAADSSYWGKVLPREFRP